MPSGTILLALGLLACGARVQPAAVVDTGEALAAAPPPGVDPTLPAEVVLTLPADARATLAPQVRAAVEAACAERGWPPVTEIDVELRCTGGQCTATAHLEPPA